MALSLKKHIPGILVFVTVAVALIAFLKPGRDIQRNEGFVVPPSRLEHIQANAPKKYNAFLSSIEYDEGSQRFTARLELEWDGTLPNPRQLDMEIAILTGKSTSPGTTIHRFSIARPFESGTRRTMDVGWKEQWFTRFNRESEYFAYVEIEPEWESSTTLLHVERNYMLNAVPLKMISKTTDGR